jgi:hypothetical protein
METEVRMFRSSSTSAMVAGMGKLPKGLLATV